MKRNLFFLLLLSFASGISAQNTITENAMTDNYELQWKEIEKLDKEDLPKSAIVVVDQILSKAVAAKNTQQTIKALIYRNKYKIEIDRQDNTQIFKYLEDLLRKTDNEVDKALLHSMLAELYLDYLDAYSSILGQRTNISGFIPDDMTEWSANIFRDKAREHLYLSVTNQSTLLNSETKGYAEIINLGEDSQRLVPTMYDFLINRAIEQSARITSNNISNTDFLKSLQEKNIKIQDLAIPTTDFIKINFGSDPNLSTLHYYQNSLQSLLNRGLNEAIVFTEIKRNNYLSDLSNNYKSNYAYNFLLNLEKANKTNDYNVEVIYAIIDFLPVPAFSNQIKSADQTTEEQTSQIYDWCKYGIDTYPNYKRINILKSKLNSLETPFANLYGQVVYYPSEEKKFKLEYKNLNKIDVQILDKKTKTVVATKQINLTPQNTYSPVNIEFVLDIDKLGDYILKTNYDNEKESKDSLEFSISGLASFARKMRRDQYEFYVVDRYNGAPVEEANIIILGTDWNHKKTKSISTIKTDKNGFAILDLENISEKRLKGLDLVYKVTKGSDKSTIETNLPYYSYYNANNTNGRDIISLFTDRSIYRPGQTVYFKVISTLQESASSTIVNENKQYKVTLYNTNNQIVSEKTLSTNEFGSLAGEFVLPKGGLTGQYRINVGNTTQYFRVEEYKRPTFDIKFDKLDKTYTFGDSVKLVGRAKNFSGINLQDATVMYNITKKSYPFWRMYSTSTEIDNGIVETNQDGSFYIDFSIPENDLRRKGFNPIYNFWVEASITDLNGETQKASYSFFVSDVSMLLDVDIPDRLDKKSKEKITVKAINLDHQPISTQGKYTLYSLLPNDSIEALILTGSFTTDSDFDIMPRLQKLPSLKYLLTLSAFDNNQKEVTSKTYFTLYSDEDKKPPIETNEWLIAKQTIFDLSQDAEIIFGVSAQDATILLDLLIDDRVLLRDQFKLSNANRKISIPYKDAYGENITASFTYVVEGISYSKQVTLNKKKEDKELNLKLEVFRDKLRSGEHEEWKISVKNKDNNAVFVELLASMYDSSLDKLSSPNQWSFNRPYVRINNPSFFRTNSFNNNSMSDFFAIRKNYKIEPLKWDQLKWFNLKLGQNRDRYFGNWNIRTATSSSLGESLALRQSYVPQPAPFPEEKQKLYKNEVITNLNDEINELRSKVSDVNTKEEVNTVPIRSNFAETAFFYPQLRTNAEGETVISFTVPESNTSWRFRALAYDKDLNEGSLEALAVSRKELMVTPNLPRFVREGDKTSISTKISNLSNQPLSGKVRIEFFDPLTDKVLDFGIKNTQKFSIDRDASTSASWLFDIPSGIDMIGVRIVAETASFSDGEQHVISVLPNRMLITESMTMNLSGKQTKNFVFDKLVNNQSKTLFNYRLTLEYSTNPAWYAVQALPTLSNPTNENAVNWFASYYVNTLGTFITKQYPKVSAMIKVWKQESGDKETLVSKLLQNEDLKTVLLEEAPWVLDAKNETEQMNRLSLLFDLNNTQMQTNQAIQKLKDLQNADGGWSWYKGMSSNRSITQYILCGFAQLTTLGAVEYSGDIKEMQIKALKYIDNQITKDYKNLVASSKKLDDATSVSSTQLEFIYVRSAYRDIPISQSARKAERFYTSVAEKNWTKLNLYGRALLSIVSQRNGNQEQVTQIQNSLREHATISEEMGMFWANNTNRVFMDQSPIVVHTFLMEAFRESKAPIEEMDMMKLWLLKQKQTQAWGTTHATVDAIYAILNNGSDWFANDGVSVIEVDNEAIKTDKTELGTGYLLKSWNSDSITNGMGNVQIEKINNGPSWGAMYWQYYENLDKITKQTGELNIDKKLFVEKYTEKGKLLFEVSAKNSLKIGDKVVIRLTVRVDRDINFVQLKDMRASCFEPISVISGIQWQNSIYYYQSTKDASTNFYFDHLSKGTYVFEYPVYVNRVGEYSNGITTIQSMYTPEFISHTQGMTVNVKD